MSKKDFRGEVWTNVDSEIINKIVEVNNEIVDGKVGNDSYTKNATKLMQQNFKTEISELKYLTNYTIFI